MHHICSYDGCLEIHYALGLCARHWDHLMRKKQQDNSPWDKLKIEDAKECVHVALGVLDDRERKIIDARRLKNKTVKEISKMLQISCVRVIQLESRGLRKMLNQLIILTRKGLL
jgi:RNA polymerase sigma factor (sigma-70 family)